MTPVTYIVPHEKTSPVFGRAFARGCGGKLEFSDRLRWAGPIALFGSPHRWTLLQHAITIGREWFYGDHAYMRRGRYYRITRNAYQFTGTSDATPERFLALGKTITPWRDSGHHIVLCPNSPTYFGLFGLDVHQWVKEVTATIHQHTDRPVRVRWKGQETPIEQDLQDAWAVVVFSSAAAIDGLLAGVPCFTLADFAATRSMGLSDLSRIESPFRPDNREAFLWTLADNQWTMNEIRDGIAWRALSQSREMSRAS